VLQLYCSCSGHVQVPVFRIVTCNGRGRWPKPTAYSGVMAFAVPYYTVPYYTAPYYTVPGIDLFRLFLKAKIAEVESEVPYSIRTVLAVGNIYKYGICCIVS
jgi:hypothetical protein